MAVATCGLVKECNKCLEDKSILFFQSFTRNMKDGSINTHRYNMCTSCRSTRDSLTRNKRKDKDPEFVKRLKWYELARSYKRHYKISFERYCEIFEEQKGQCAICSKEFNNTGIDMKRDKLYVDHNHTTGLVRGLLCKTCNVGIGMFKEDINIIKKTINYLENNRGIN